jgi:hypothetical protein
MHVFPNIHILFPACSQWIYSLYTMTKWGSQSVAITSVIVVLYREFKTTEVWSCEICRIIQVVVLSSVVLKKLDCST